jgi:hypothetical protein
MKHKQQEKKQNHNYMNLNYSSMTIRTRYSEQDGKKNALQEILNISVTSPVTNTSTNVNHDARLSRKAKLRSVVLCMNQRKHLQITGVSIPYIDTTHDFSSLLSVFKA